MFSTLKLLFLFTVSVLFGNGQSSVGSAEYVTVDIRRPDTRMMSAFGAYHDLEVNFRHGDKNIEMRLQKNEHIGDVPIRILKEGDTLKKAHCVRVERSIKAYQDVYHGAAIATITDVGKNEISDSKLVGTFISDGTQYSIEKSNNSDSNVYLVEKVDDVIGFYDSLKDIIQRKKRSADPTNIVEMLIVLDYTVYKYWLDRSTGATESEIHAAAVESLMFYYVAVLNGVDIRYRSVTTVSIGIKPVEFVITTTPGNSGWTLQNSWDHSPRNGVNGTKALGDFRAWVLTDVTIPHDHAMLFTRLDIWRQSVQYSVAGIAYVGTICGSASQSFVEERISFQVSSIAAHELGHSLGLKHDGDADNTCGEQDGYVMNPGTNNTLEDQKLNHWKFSSCSQNKLRQSIDSLGTGSCLLVLDNTTPRDLSGYQNPSFGMSHDIQEQCRLAISDNSSACLSLYEGDTGSLCLALWCRLDDTLCRLVVPAEGTTCESQKICSSGKCVSSDTAPVIDCMGDWFPTCEDQSPERCYYNYNTSCCGSCENMKRDSLPAGCEYGDRTTDCADLEAPLCYNNEEVCCEKCLAYVNSTLPSACRYGDKSTQCAGLEAPRCYANEDVCCGTCAGHFHSELPTACRFGDKSTQCAGLAPHLCYANEELCCGTCAGHFNSGLPTECRYGDKTPQCTGLAAYRCYANENVCCGTCAGHLVPGLPTDCKFGDKSQSCDDTLCDSYSTEWLNICCSTCSHRLNVVG